MINTGQIAASNHYGNYHATNDYQQPTSYYQQGNQYPVGNSQYYQNREYYNRNAYASNNGNYATQGSYTARVTPRSQNDLQCTYCSRYGHGYDVCRTRLYQCYKCGSDHHGFRQCDKFDSRSGNGGTHRKARNIRENGNSAPQNTQRSTNGTAQTNRIDTNGQMQNNNDPSQNLQRNIDKSLN